MDTLVMPTVRPDDVTSRTRRPLPTRMLAKPASQRGAKHGHSHYSHKYSPLLLSFDESMRSQHPFRLAAYGPRHRCHCDRWQPSTPIHQQTHAQIKHIHQ